MVVFAGLDFAAGKLPEATERFALGTADGEEAAVGGRDDGADVKRKKLSQRHEGTKDD